MPKDLVVVKSNAIIESAYEFTRLEHMIILSCVAQVNSKSKLLETDQFEISVSNIADMLGRNNAYEDLKVAVERLFKRYVIIEFEASKTKSKRKEILKTRWVSSVKYITSEGRIILRFSQDMLPYLSQIEGYYAEYKLQYVTSMTSVYGIRLYELLLCWQTEGSKEIEIDWLRNIFQIDKAKYSRMYDLKKWVIEPAVNDINTHSNLWIKVGQRKTGRSVTHLQFEFGLKEQKIKPPIKKITKKLKEKKIYGISMSRISKEARPGESHNEAARRIFESA